MSKPIEAQDVALTIVRVDANGNAGGGAYFFDFVPHPVLVEAANATLVFTLSPQTPPEFAIDALVSSDALGQLGAPMYRLDRRQVSVSIRNDRPYLMQVALLVSDGGIGKNGRPIVCDPQVICRPPPDVTA